MANKEILKESILRDLNYLQGRATDICKKIVQLGFDNTLSEKEKAGFIEAYKGMLKNDVSSVYESILELINKIKEEDK